MEVDGKKKTQLNPIWNTFEMRERKKERKLSPLSRQMSTVCIVVLQEEGC